MPEIKPKVNRWGEVIYESMEIICAECGERTYISGRAIKFSIENHKPILQLCPDCASRKIVEGHKK